MFSLFVLTKKHFDIYIIIIILNDLILKLVVESKQFKTIYSLYN